DCDVLSASLHPFPFLALLSLSVDRAGQCPLAPGGEAEALTLFPLSLGSPPSVGHAGQCPLGPPPTVRLPARGTTTTPLSPKSPKVESPSHPTPTKKKIKLTRKHIVLDNAVEMEPHSPVPNTHTTTPPTPLLKRITHTQALETLRVQQQYMEHQHL